LNTRLQSSIKDWIDLVKKSLLKYKLCKEADYILDSFPDYSERPIGNRIYFRLVKRRDYVVCDNEIYAVVITYTAYIFNGETVIDKLHVKSVEETNLTITK